MFDLSKLGKGEWFPYQDSKVNPQTGEIEWLPIDSKSKDRVCFKQIDPDEMIVRQEKYRGTRINNPVLNTATRQMEIIITYEQTPEQKKDERMDFWDAVIPEWELYDSQEKLIPCTAENKYKLVKGHAAFLRFCNRSLELLSSIKNENAKAAEKN